MPGKKKAAVDLEALFATLDDLRPVLEEALTQDVPDKIKAGLNVISSGIGTLQNQRWEIAALERA